jgi:phosphonate transport system ATP-binding protein
LLRLNGLRKEFPRTTAVADVSLDFAAGEMVGIIGRSGAGKSTLLRLINRLVEPTTGRILWKDREVTALRGRQLDAWRGRCAMIFQQFDLVERLDVMTNVLIGRAGHASTLACLFKQFSRAERAFAIRALERLDMLDFALQRAASLSGGQQQRVAIARALLQEPEILLADEPIASLDPRSAGLVMDALRSLNRDDGITVLCNLHSLDIARAYCDRIVGMARGAVVFDGPPAALTPAAVREIYGIEHETAADRADPPEAGPEARPVIAAVPRRVAGAAGGMAVAEIAYPRET